jgi:hypothetical protein
VSPVRKQRGMVLIVTLAMLVVITLFVISMVRLGNTNAIIVGNMQAQKGVEAEAQQALEIAMNKFSFFDDAIQSTNSWATPATDPSRNDEQYVLYANLWTAYLPTGATTAPATLSDAAGLKVYRPQCLFFEPTAGYSALSGIAPQDTYWDIAAVASDSKTGASTEIHQGVEMRLPAGNCQ